ncbi:Dipeptidyl aminopeptidase/acylaminoacyl peptidase [Pustulibacterium marinum]|uniref:Dipeptidyl aminopeptidase/acylaminoacyl peptidase n=2 Tax=Pustulibacterium marinum TaxID=1224947 RepID=A0A1I7GWJ6_9FLAO|nr:Dipeptidyl aminopeptidase/acylaminoacyl peptidase [Pustulibacterium marinum]
MFFVAILSFSVYAQGTIEDYKRAETVQELFSNKVYHNPSEFNWVNNRYVWYKDNSQDGIVYYMVDADEKKQDIAFNHNELASQLSSFTQRRIISDSLELTNVTFNNELDVLSFQYHHVAYDFEINDAKLIQKDSVKENDKTNRSYWGGFRDDKKGKPVLSPNKTYKAYIKNHNVYISSSTSSEEIQLSFDGSSGFYYSTHLMWSPDSEKLLAYKVKPGEDHKIYFVESSPKDQIQPKLQERQYRKPGDEVDFISPQLFNVESKKQFKIPTSEIQQQYNLGSFEWSSNSNFVTFEYNQRGHQEYKVFKIDATTGKLSTIIRETSTTFIDYSSKRYKYIVNDSQEIIWASERDGYYHLYLYDVKSGKLKNQITKGKWPVRNVVHVDEKNRVIYFTASGLYDNQDPYFIQYCKVDFDGRNFKKLTFEDGNHHVTFSPDYSKFIDVYSRVDMAPVAVLKETSNKKSLLLLQKANIAALQATGWQTPEPFVAKGRDGKTDIWGIIVRPTNFDEKKIYPVIEYIYAGPHSSFVPKDFTPYYWAMSSLAELGFIVVQIDGMGTSNRSKAFHDVCWQNLKDAGFPDRKLWIKAAAQKYSYIDANRVGIRGTSAGGQNAGAALVFNSDFYDVAVASCGCHDNRMDKIWWNEQWMGYPVGPQYQECSNVVNAHKLQGKLMLMVGEVDDNVDPASTMQFADALISAGKDFELVVLPGENHTAGGEFGERKRRDFFVKHLLHITPPDWSLIYQ